MKDGVRNETRHLQNSAPDSQAWALFPIRLDRLKKFTAKLFVTVVSPA